MEQPLSVLPLLLNTVKKKMMGKQLEIFEKYDIHRSQVPYLVLLWNNQDGLTQKEMIGRTKMDKAHASRALQELITKNVIVKEDKTGYKHKYFLSPYGLEIAQTVKAKNQDLFEELFSVLSTEEKDELERILRKVTDHIQSVSKE